MLQRKEAAMDHRRRIRNVEDAEDTAGFPRLIARRTRPDRLGRLKP